MTALTTTPPSLATRDATLSTAVDLLRRIATLVEQLKAAVDSIPSYIERSCMMWVVVPPCKHQNLDTICDFASWRRRGWCRMEFAASKLACGSDMPLMVIKSQEQPPEFINPCDMFKLNPARGEFSVEADRDKVNATLKTMLHAKAESYAQMPSTGLWARSRTLRATRRRRCGGRAWRDETRTVWGNMYQATLGCSLSLCATKA